MVVFLRLAWVKGWILTAFSRFFSVQHECIPQAVLGMDILCQAKSGMGKTAVFVLATLQQIEPVDGQVSEQPITQRYRSIHIERARSAYVKPLGINLNLLQV